MRNADPVELEILYNAADRSSGRNYLTKRLDQSPRQKYYFPEATSWRIGWIQSWKRLQEDFRFCFRFIFTEQNVFSIEKKFFVYKTRDSYKM